jgi:hypothetical protein
MLHKYLNYIQEDKDISINFLGKHKVNIIFDNLDKGEIQKTVKKIEKNYTKILEKIKKDLTSDVKRETKGKMSINEFIGTLKPIYIRFQKGDETYSIDLIFDCGKVFGNHTVNVQLDKNLNIKDAYVGIEG